MKIFVTGATGYIGNEVARALFRAGHSVVGLVRTQDNARRIQMLQIEPVLGDLGKPDTYAVAAASCDAIVHTAMETSAQAPAIDQLVIDALLDAARRTRQPRTIIYTSGVWVLGNTGTNPVDELGSTEHPAPLVAWRVAHEKKVLAANGGKITTAVIRPGIVYGGNKGLMMQFFKSAVRQSGTAYVGDGKNHWSSIHRDDAADLYTRVVEAAESGLLHSIPAHERIFHAVDGMSSKVIEIAEAVSRVEGEEGKTKQIPLEEARKTMGPLADCLVLDQVVTAARTEKLLGWKPRHKGFVHNVVEIFEEWARSI